MKEKKKFRASLASLAELCFLGALGTGIGFLLRYVWGWNSYQTGLRDILIYTSIGVALLLVYIVHIALRRLRKKREETAKTGPDEKRPSGKRKNSLLSLILSFCLPFALTLFLLSILSGYSFSDIIDTFSLPEITVYVAVGGGILLAHILTRKPRKRASKNSPEKEGKEEL